MGCVYLVEGPRGSYIGKTVKTLAYRMKQHLAAAARGEDWAFYRAMRKHPEGWSWSELLQSDSNEELLAGEIAAIAEHRARGARLYNSTNGGQGTVGRALSAETRAKIGAKAAGRISPNKGRPSPLRGSKVSAETKARASEAMRAYWASRRALGLAMRHGEITDAGRMVLSASARERWETRRATGVRAIGK